MGFVHQQVQGRATVLWIGSQCIPVFASPALGFEHARVAFGNRMLQSFTLLGQLFGANAAPHGRHRKNNDDDQGDTRGVRGEQQLPDTLDTQQPGRKDKQTDQDQPLKPQWFNFPMGVAFFEPCEKRLQIRPPVKEK